MKNTKSLKAHKHNDLIQARYSVMTMPEQLLLLAVIGQIDPRKLTAETSVEITVSDFRDLVNLNTDRHDSYNQLKQAVKRLYNRSVIIKNPDPLTMNWLIKKKAGQTIEFTRPELPFK